MHPEDLKVIPDMRRRRGAWEATLVQRMRGEGMAAACARPLDHSKLTDAAAVQAEAGDLPIQLLPEVLRVEGAVAALMGHP